MDKSVATLEVKRNYNYDRMISQESMDELRDRILQILIIKKKYKDKDYTAQQLAEDLHSNTRYISAVFNAKFHMSYSSFINKHRIEDAMALLRNMRNTKLSMENVSDMVGYANRQTFYTAFYKITGKTPRQYKMERLAKKRARVGRPLKQPTETPQETVRRS